jgi:spore coat polysaccharide biosynthesis predicted glycosyltransferase SpsG
MVGRNYLSARKNVKRNYYGSRYLKVFIFMGGIDKDNFTTAALRTLQSSKNLDRIFFNVVVGSKYSYLEDLNNLIKNNLSARVKIFRGLPSLDKIIAESDIGIASGGSNSWERCCLGLPSITIPVAANQIDIANEISKFGASRTVEIANLSKIDYIFDEIISSPKILNRMSKRAMSLVDGLGAGRVAREILCIK